MDQYEASKRLGRAAQAKSIINDELYGEAMDAIRERFLENWLQTGSHDSKDRELIWVMIKMINVLDRYFKDIATDGDVVEAMIRAGNLDEYK